MQIKIHAESPPRSGSIPQPNGTVLGNMGERKTNHGWTKNKIVSVQTRRVCMFIENNWMTGRVTPVGVIRKWGFLFFYKHLTSPRSQQTTFIKVCDARHNFYCFPGALPLVKHIRFSLLIVQWCWLWPKFGKFHFVWISDHDNKCKSKSVQNPRHEVAAYANPMASPWDKKRQSVKL